ncbi:hypothetical protein AAMO2058_001721500 [Amorphochlora amoebiformis]
MRVLVVRGVPASHQRWACDKSAQEACNSALRCLFKHRQGATIRGERGFNIQFLDFTRTMIRIEEFLH